MLRLAFVLCCIAWIACRATAAEKPNVIIINIDDLGYGDIGPFGNTTQPTPNLDRMASEGRKLTSHYAAPVCSPSRASLMTGCYPKRALPVPHVLFPVSAVGLHPDEITIAELLKKAGYSTACVGKWHLGDQPDFLPTRQGFDSYFGLPYSNDMGTVEDGSKSNYGVPIPDRKSQRAGDKIPEDGIRGNTQPPLPLIENEQVIERVRAQEQATLVRRYTEKAKEFIKAQADKPFFLYFPHTAVHFPLYPDAPFRGKSDNGLFGDWVNEVDWSVGEVLDLVDELGIAEETLVIFTSDNGGQERHGANNGPLRAGKGTTYEGGMRVPTICRWPGKIPANSASKSITTTMDLLPTIAYLAGVEVPEDRVIDGVNIWPALSGEGNSGRNLFLYFRGFKLEAVRKGGWKLRLENGELYNLEADIGEETNVAAKNPEIVEELQSIAAANESDLGNATLGPGCRVIGRVESPKPWIESD